MAVAKHKYFDYHIFTHSLFFISLTVIVYFWVTLPHTAYYTLQLAVLFLLAYFLNYRLSHRLHKVVANTKVKALLLAHYELIINLSLIGGVVFLLVAVTGGIQSPWFFLVYFLMFAMAILLDREMVVIYTLVTLIFFSLLPSTASLYWYFTRLLSLVLIAPVAYYIGYKYQQIREQKAVLYQLKKTESDIESNILLWLKLVCLPSLRYVIDKISVLMPSATVSQKDTLGGILAKTKQLAGQADDLARKVDEMGDAIEQ